MSRFFDDINIGDAAALGSHTFGADEIKTFAHKFDPQRFHIDEEEAKRSHFGRLAASGWHTAAVAMRLLVGHRMDVADAMRAKGEPVAKTGPSPGIRALKWLKPVYVGDTISYAREVTETRPSSSRPEWGLVTNTIIGTNQDGAPVISFVATGFVERRT